MEIFSPLPDELTAVLNDSNTVSVIVGQDLKPPMNVVAFAFSFWRTEWSFVAPTPFSSERSKRTETLTFIRMANFSRRGLGCPVLRLGRYIVLAV
jgi:hypothetical protein